MGPLCAQQACVRCTDHAKLGCSDAGVACEPILFMVTKAVKHPTTTRFYGPPAVPGEHASDVWSHAKLGSSDGGGSFADPASDTASMHSEPHLPAGLGPSLLGAGSIASSMIAQVGLDFTDVPSSRCEIMSTSCP